MMAQSIRQLQLVPVFTAKPKIYGLTAPRYVYLGKETFTLSPTCMPTWLNVLSKHFFILSDSHLLYVM